MKHTKKCPECGETEIYKTEAFANGQGIHLLYGVGGMIRNPAKLDCFVCANCRFYQLFVGENWLSEIPQKWQRHE